ncbi:hypothetical protein [Alkalibacillus salilacus]|uniref:Bifunctional DNA-binding transcriptional regulator/antitoxin component of YhaV-PrlF toxin-antitoxin module n=1 Tax=Alkalibacillus salilacus TaxID=284582 RepID=A0ABT9VCV9_9BACI|nr:hypothetical protein [Alkalibacillus salilacus]MDQ0158799.1 bifunctional DNA-binding transcriptional regulator/antitoxin component of YhaV-PrlF toxin-antitoxin module [Alkalibacillus salilacus]
MQQYLGTLKRLDGNVVEIPVEKLKTAGIAEDGNVEVFSNEQAVFIRSTDKHCDVCGHNNGKLKQVGQMNMCKVCRDELKNDAD